MPSEAQIRRLYAIANSKGWTHGGVKRLLELNYRLKSTKELSPQQYGEVCTFLENALATDIVTMNRDPNTSDMFEETSHVKR